MTKTVDLLKAGDRALITSRYDYRLCTVVRVTKTQIIVQADGDTAPFTERFRRGPTTNASRVNRGTWDTRTLSAVTPEETKALEAFALVHARVEKIKIEARVEVRELADMNNLGRLASLAEDLLDVLECASALGILKDWDGT